MFRFTGLRKPLKDQVTTSPLLLYQIVCHGSSGRVSFPVGQMVSQAHDMEWLTHWLRVWIHQVQQQFRKQKTIVNECVLDESAALIGACVAAFTQGKTTVQYIDRCMQVLLHNRGELSECFMRVDRSHFVKSVHKNLKKGFSSFIARCNGIPHSMF